MNTHLITKTSLLSIFIYFSLTILPGSISCKPYMADNSNSTRDKYALAGIFYAQPQCQIHSEFEISEIRRHLNDPSYNPDKFRHFLMLISKIKTEAIAGEISRLSHLYQSIDSSLETITTQEQRKCVDMAFSRCELPLITKQLLDRERLALEIWRPGMSTEKALAEADNRQRDEDHMISQQMLKPPCAFFPK